MAFNKRIWKGRQGTGLNKFSINGATPVTVINQPDSVTQVGDALSAGNLNDLEDRIEDAFDDVDTALDTKANEQDVTNLNDALTQLDHRLDNIEQSKGDYIVSSYKDGSTTPSGKGKWCVVEGVEGVSRVENNVAPKIEIGSGWDCNPAFGTGVVSDNKIVYTITTQRGSQSIRRTTGNGGVVFRANHSYLIFFDLTLTEASDHVRVCYMDTLWTTDVSVNANVKTRCAYFVAPTVVGNNTFFGVYPSFGAGISVGGTATLENVTVVDLTVYFNGSIPTNAQTIAGIQTNYPHLLIPSDYGTRIVDWTGNGVRAWGKNLISGFQVGKDWALLSNPERACFRLDNPSYIGKNMVLSATWPSTVNTIRVVRIRDANVRPNSFTYEEPISIEIVGNVTMTQAIVDECKAQLELGTTATSYSPYMENTLSFPSTSLKSAGSVREKYLLESGEVTHPLKDRLIADSELNYTKAGGIFYALLSDAKPVADSNVKANILCDKFFATSRNGMTQKGQFSISSSGSTVYINFYWDDVSIDAFKTAMAGVSFRYELNVADPSTPATAILDNTLLTEAYGRLSTVQTGTVVDGIADLGFITL